MIESKRPRFKYQKSAFLIPQRNKGELPYLNLSSSNVSEP